MFYKYKKIVRFLTQTCFMNTKKIIRFFIQTWVQKSIFLNELKVKVIDYRLLDTSIEFI